ncbi:MAG: hypothetical protein ACRDT6_07170 [Micromonosporaceae bacterium]
MSIQIPTQPIPADVAEACAWLSAAERHTGPPHPARLEERLDAGDVLDILLAVDPPYPPIDTSRPAMPLAAAAPKAIQALQRAIQQCSSPAQRLQAARALGQLQQVQR